MNLDPSLLSSLYGLGSGATTQSAGNAATAIAVLRRATAPGAQEKGVAQERKDPVAIAALAQFKRSLASAKDVKQALADPRIQAVLLPAVGLADQLGNAGLVQKALLADTSKPGNLAAQLGTRWVTAAEKLGLKGQDISALRAPALVQTLSDSYVTYQYQKGLDAQQPGMSDALYFLNNASQGASNVYNVLGDAVLRRVVTGALGLPQQLAFQGIETQARAVSSHLQLSTLNDPKAVFKLAQRYLMTQAGGAGLSLTA